MRLAKRLARATRARRARTGSSWGMPENNVALMAPTFEALLYDVHEHVATITINRPDRRNALSRTAISELRRAVAEAKADPDVRVVVITGAGDRAFSAGADLSGMAEGAGFADLHEARGGRGRP